MVLFIVALILGGVLTPLSTRLEQANRKQAEDMLKEIKNSLIGYALVTGHLPCPDCPGNGASPNCGNNTAVSNDGVEDGLDNASTPVSPRINNNFVNGCVVQVGRRHDRDVTSRSRVSGNLRRIIHVSNIYPVAFRFLLDRIPDQDLRRIIQVLHGLRRH